MEIYTTGAYLFPIKGVDGRWYWAVGEFEEDSFYDGDIFNPTKTALTKEELEKSGESNE